MKLLFLLLSLVIYSACGNNKENGSGLGSSQKNPISPGNIPSQNPANNSGPQNNPTYQIPQNLTDNSRSQNNPTYQIPQNLTDNSRSQNNPPVELPSKPEKSEVSKQKPNPPKQNPQKKDDIFIKLGIEYNQENQKHLEKITSIYEGKNPNKGTEFKEKFMNNEIVKKYNTKKVVEFLFGKEFKEMLEKKYIDDKEAITIALEMFQDEEFYNRKINVENIKLTDDDKYIIMRNLYILRVCSAILEKKGLKKSKILIEAEEFFVDESFYSIDFYHKMNENSVNEKDLKAFKEKIKNKYPELNMDKYYLAQNIEMTKDTIKNKVRNNLSTLLDNDEKYKKILDVYANTKITEAPLFLKYGNHKVAPAISVLDEATKADENSKTINSEYLKLLEQKKK